jgi:8-oxo-dGTP pyrophosphatase MutT (NUDIX family)
MKSPKANKKGALSAGVVVVRFFEGRPRYLLLRAYRYWDFPKGLVDVGEEPLSAACREVAEEAGLTDLLFRWGKEFRETPPYRNGKVARYYLAEAPTGEPYLPVSPELGRPEHQEFRWLTVEEARVMVADRVKPILDWAHGLVTESSKERN